MEGLRTYVRGIYAVIHKTGAAKDTEENHKNEWMGQNLVNGVLSHPF